MKNSLIHLFSDITNLFWVKLEEYMQQIELHSGQIFVLISLWENNGQTQVELAKNLNVSPPTINKMIKSLSKSDFVSPIRNKTDARKVQVFLTPKGVDVRTKVEEQWQKLEDDFFSPLNETEKLIIQQIFGKLKEELITKNKA